MKSRYIFSILFVIVQILFFSNITTGANLWKSGYFISNSGDTTQCLIKDEDWKNNPIQFKWKNSKEDETRIASIEFISLFSIDSNVMYMRDTIQFETSSTKIDHLSDHRDPEFESKIVFLRVLVLGDASLYYYEKKDAQRFFFSNTDRPSPEALIYKIYLDDDDQIRQNFKYREQIWKGFDCKEITLKKINEIEYDRKELVQLFIEINNCLGSDIINFVQFRTKGIFKLNAFLSANIMHSRFSNSFFRVEEDYPATTAWQIGLEIEYLIPFWNNSWSISVAPSLIKYRSIGIYRINSIPTSTLLNFISLDINLVVRKYFSIFSEETLFVNGGIVIGFPIQSDFIATKANNYVPVSRNFIIGAGYKILDNLSAEIRYGFDRNYRWPNNWKVNTHYYGLMINVKLF